ncbi:molybdopterin-binding protein [Actinoplanes sp. OR16]|uniref:molybdopterin-dependent oxidoreductase n=1 Tax=Actinoplanes sp. OR16 TaxID=946334 RepID=UPI000F6ECD65|nr:molybdopterin-dependent oxidoreductase [Actinoplanes sp. OR16]BBH67819.1 molybdopterin-binding protein [Actinoplanes sp. OR16]
MVRDPGRRLSGLLTWLTTPLPPPPERLRRGPLRPGAFPSPLRSARLSANLGAALGVMMLTCLITGVLSHLIQHPPAWFTWPSRPIGLYRFTQGLHVATGLATVPLLGAKLWSVYPRLFAWPPARSIAHAAERLSVALLVAAALSQTVSGLLNIAHWYTPMPFFFTTGHYRVAWLLTGAVLIHLGVKLPLIRATWRRPAPPDGRRQVLAAAGAAAALITVSTLGQTVRPLAGISLLAPRRPGSGPQRLPVNRTAAAAGVRDLALDPGYRLTISGPGGGVSLTLAELQALPQHTAVLPIACVEGWSSTGTWTGVRLRDLITLAGDVPAAGEAVVESLQADGRYRTSVLAGPHLTDGLTLLALRLAGEPLALDHGYPARLIAPNRPGVLQTKWVTRITVREAR